MMGCTCWQAGMRRLLLGLRVAERGKKAAVHGQRPVSFTLLDLGNRTPRCCDSGVRFSPLLLCQPSAPCRCCPARLGQAPWRCTVRLQASPRRHPRKHAQQAPCPACQDTGRMNASA